MRRTHENIVVRNYGQRLLLFWLLRLHVACGRPGGLLVVLLVLVLLYTAAAAAAAAIIVYASEQRKGVWEGGPS
jgi:hypothetical protein